jgi:hypothetical protein
MRSFLRRSISSINQNKLRGLLAEVDLRGYLQTLGYGDKVSPGGWIARREGPGSFGHNTVVMFPETVVPGQDYGPDRTFPQPSHGLHTICSTFHQSGIAALYCAASVGDDDNALSLVWKSVQLGLPTQQEYKSFPDSLTSFLRKRPKAFAFLRYKTDTETIPDAAIPEEFSKEHLRVAFQERFLAEVSDIDGIFWGEQFTYPVEIKEKTAAADRQTGEYFGLDLGPFVKLAFYAAKRGNLHSLFVVREIESIENRQLKQWWFITFDKLAQFASWIPRGGGTNMLGGASTVVRVPKAEFQPLNGATLAAL